LDEGDWVYMQTTLPGLSIGKAQQLLQQSDKLIKSIPEVERVFGKIGRAETATDPAPLTMIETVIQFKPKSEWRKGMTSRKLKEELNQAVNLPGLTNAWVMPIKTRIDMLATGIKTPVGIKLRGPDLMELQTVGEEIENVLQYVTGTASAYADRSVGGRYINIDIDRIAGARFGLNIADVQEVVRTAIGGFNVTTTIEGRESYPVNLRYPQSERDSVESIRMLPIVTPTGAHIPLDDVSDVSVAEGPPVIKSEDARLTSWILVDIKDIDVGTYIQLAKKAIDAHVDIPEGVSLQWSGQYEYMQRAKERLMMLIPFTLVIIILLLFLNFRAIGEVLVILTTLPLALTGGVWLLYLLGYNLSVAVGVGFIALAGVAVEIGILMLVYLNQAFTKQVQAAKQASRPMTYEDIKTAIVEGALLRVRPIIMTVAATIGALLPIMLGSGTGSEVMRRIAAPMIGGMVSATLLTLLLIPTVYLVWKGFHLKQLNEEASKI